MSQTTNFDVCDKTFRNTLLIKAYKNFFRSLDLKAFVAWCERKPKL